MSLRFPGLLLLPLLAGCDGLTGGVGFVEVSVRGDVADATSSARVQPPDEESPFEGDLFLNVVAVRGLYDGDDPDGEPCAGDDDGDAEGDEDEDEDGEWRIL